MTIELITRDVYLRHTAEAARLADKAREQDEPAAFRVEQITEDQYRNERNAR